MNIYPLKKIQTEYETGKMTVETAMGHHLQHTGKLYLTQIEVIIQYDQLRNEHLELKKRVLNLESEAKSLRGEMRRLKTAPLHTGDPKTAKDTPPSKRKLGKQEKDKV